MCEELSIPFYFKQIGVAAESADHEAHHGGRVLNGAEYLQFPPTGQAAVPKSVPPLTSPVKKSTEPGLSPASGASDNLMTILENERRLLTQEIVSWSDRIAQASSEQRPILETQQTTAVRRLNEVTITLMALALP